MPIKGTPLFPRSNYHEHATERVIMKSPAFPTMGQAAIRRRKARYAFAARSFFGVTVMGGLMLFVDGSNALFAASLIGFLGGGVAIIATCVASGISTEYDMKRDG